MRVCVLWCDVPKIFSGKLAQLGLASVIAFSTWPKFSSRQIFRWLDVGDVLWEEWHFGRVEMYTPDFFSQLWIPHWRWSFICRPVNVSSTTFFHQIRRTEIMKFLVYYDSFMNTSTVVPPTYDFPTWRISELTIPLKQHPLYLTSGFSGLRFRTLISGFGKFLQKTQELGDHCKPCRQGRDVGSW
jgi:hypothetical protein